MPLDGTLCKAEAMRSVAAWLETRDPKVRYRYDNISGGCMAAQYCHAHGLGYGSREGFRVPVANPRGNFRAQLEYIAAAPPHTYGAALVRTKELV